MKKNLLTVLTCFVLSISFIDHTNAQGTLVYYWNFNITDTTMSSPHTPQYTVAGGPSASILYYYGTSGYIDFTNPGTSLNAQMGADSGWSLRLRTPGDSMIISMPTTGYANVHFSYATEKSGSGPSPVYVYYTNDGVHFMPTCVTDLVDSCVYTTQAVWAVQTYDFAADAATANNPNFAVKISYGAWTGGGNNRFDNMALLADTANTSLGTVAVDKNVSGYSLFPNPANDQINLIGPIEGQKTVEINNLLGQKVFSTIESDKQFEISTSNLASGVYFITILNNTTGNSSMLRFVKQ